MSSRIAECLNAIIAIFLQQNVIELSDQDLNNAIRGNKNRYSIEELHRAVQSSGSSLFHFDSSQENTSLIRVEPKIGICEKFLGGKCNFKTEGCDQLHICRRFGNCNKRDCHFPHDFNRGNNRRLVEQYHCQTVNSLLLVRLIQHYEAFARRSHQASRVPNTASTVSNITSPSVESKLISSAVKSKKRARPRRKRHNANTECVAVGEDNLSRSTSSILLPDCNHRIDISFPSNMDKGHISIEDVVGLLRRQGFLVQETLNMKIDRYFRRCTLQFEKQSDVDTLLTTPNLFYEGVYIKLKKSKASIDQKRFILKAQIDSRRGPITMPNFSNYVDILIPNCPYKIQDLSTLLEQILLVECNDILDFEQLYRTQKSRRQLQGADIILQQIYEIEALIMESINDSLSMELIENVIQPAIANVFAYRLLSNRRAIIEFTDSSYLKTWLIRKDAIQKNFGINITLDIKYADNNDDAHASDSVSCSSADERSEELIKTTKVSQTVVYLGRAKKMIVNHPTFSIEYKNYIRSELGVEIYVRDKRIEINASSCANAHVKEKASNLLRRVTQKFISQFTILPVTLNRVNEQVNVLRANSAVVAFYHVKDNKYMIAAKQSGIETIMAKVFAIKQNHTTPENHQHWTTSSNQNSSKNFYPKQLSTFSIPPPLSNSSIIEDKTIVNNTIVDKKISLAFNKSAQVTLFNDTTFQFRLESYFETKYAIKLRIEHDKETKSQCLVKIIGKACHIDSVQQELHVLVSSCRTETFDETIDWTKISDAVRVIQHRLNLDKVICVCEQQLFPISILVHYIDKQHTTLGVDKLIIDTLCRKKLIFAKCTSNKFEKEWPILKKEILQRNNYGKDICLLDEQHTISLYGLPDIVKKTQQLFEDKKTIIIQSIIKTDTIKTDQAITEKQNISKIQQISKLEEAPLHQGYHPIKPQTITTHTISFDIDEPGFESLVRDNFDRLMILVGSSCLLKKDIISYKVQIQVPTAKQHYSDNPLPQSQEQQNNSNSTNAQTTDSANATSSWFFRLFQPKKRTTPPPPNSTQNQNSKSTTASTSTQISSVNMAIGNSKIIVCTGDLAKQVVDIIVVCSTSRILCDAIISAAGPEVQNVYRYQQSQCDSTGLETSGGNLQCKRIVFRPWICDKNQTQNLKPSIESFVASVIQYALRNSFTTIAFPSIGCGQLGYDPRLIAEYMIGETHRQIATSCISSSLIVSFVLWPEQQNVYDAFAHFLDKLQSIKDKPHSISFDRHTVRITLSGSNNNQLIECQNKIKQLAQSSSIKVHLKDKNDMSDWPQHVIMEYYDYCLQRRVIPSIDIKNSTLDLIGSKDAVNDVEKYFFQLTAETLRNAKLKFILHGTVWSVETSHDNWEQYSYRTNKLIQDAQSRNSPYVEFINEESERCRVNFSSMEEEYQSRKRKVRRTRIDSVLPPHWDLSGNHLRRITLLDSSKEYKDILTPFHSTMKDNYGKIIRIERIQNERWYKQYAAHRDEFTQRYGQPDERRLFHGCSNTSADQIIQECFNRAFAGLNGTLYGQGVYFHEHAKYSHNYTKPTLSNERTMFLALVLIGKTCIGNSSMKVPPSGFDTTTDGTHIFVVYHDAGAYGEYLITYR